MSATRTPAEIADLFPAYPYDRHRPIVDQGAVVDERVRAGRDPRRHPQAVAPARVGRRRGRPGAGAPGGARPRRRCSARATASAPTRGSSTATTPRPASRSSPTTRTSGPSMPGIWYQMGLHCTTLSDDCPFDVSGFTFSGLPGVVIGHNQQIAWGFTNLGPDVIDLFLEKVQDKSYLYDGRQRPLQLRDEEIKVLGRSEPFRFTVRSTGHGPLLSDVSSRAEHRGRERAGRRRGPRPRQRVRRLDRLDRPHARARPRTRSSRSTRPPTGSSSGPRPPTSRCPRRTSSTPTAPATSATRRRAGSRSASPATPATTRPSGWLEVRRLDRPVRPVRRAAQRAEPVRRVRRHRQPGGDRARTTPTTSATRGRRATAASGSWTCCERRAKVSVADMSRIQLRHPQRVRADASCPTCSRSSCPRTTSPAVSGC